jgi:hypothetical protein
MWIWKPLQPRLWHQHSSSEHGSFRRWPEMWSLLPAGMQPTSMVRAWSTSLDGDSHESMSTQLGTAQQRRRVVQSSPPALRPRSACLHPARPTHCWNCSCLLQKGSMCETRRIALHHQRQPMVPVGADHKRGRSRGCAASVGDVFRAGLVDANAAELGPELAVRRSYSVWPVSLLHDNHQ